MAALIILKVTMRSVRQTLALNLIQTRGFNRDRPLVELFEQAQREFMDGR